MNVIFGAIARGLVFVLACEAIVATWGQARSHHLNTALFVAFAVLAAEALYSTATLPDISRVQRAAFGLMGIGLCCPALIFLLRSIKTITRKDND